MLNWICNNCKRTNPEKAIYCFYCRFERNSTIEGKEENEHN